MQPLGPDDSSDLSLQIGRRIEARRSALGLSQTELARRLGMPAAEIAAYERGENDIAAVTVFRIASVLETPLGVLMGELVGTDDDEAFLLGLNEPGAVEMVQAFAAIHAVEARAALLAVAQEMALDDFDETTDAPSDKKRRR